MVKHGSYNTDPGDRHPSVSVEARVVIEMAYMHEGG